MKKLILKQPMSDKLDCLKNRVGQLHYAGKDPNDILTGPTVAIVGTRKPTPYGKQITEQLATELARAGVVIVSGLAFGVDTIAHKAVLAENGKTIAILPSGLENVYPATHVNTARDIQKNGSLISEYSAKHKPTRYDFLDRNRIIAALSDIIIIPEAAAHSGSLNTANHALDMDITVCALPGQTSSPMSQGTNQIIKKGQATMITSAQDVLDLLDIKVDEKKKLAGDSEQESAILQAIASGVSDSTLLQQETGLKTSDFQTTMTMLEINGKVQQNEVGGWHLS